MISYYELLGMIKEDKAPEKIRVHLTHGTSKLYVRESDIDDTFSYYGLLNEDEENEEYKYYLSECLLESSMFDENIEIIEEEKKIPEKLDIRQEKNCKNNWKWKVYGEEHSYNISTPQKLIADKVNEIIDYLKSKGE